MSIFSRIRSWLPAILVGQLLFASASPAGELAQPAGTAILTITGAITQTNAPGSARFDMAMLEQLGTDKVRTSTPWHHGVVEFEGVRLDRLMEAVGATGSEVVATALNDYSATLPLSDFARFGVILATKRDGAYMPVRDKGPLFIVYPFDNDPDLQVETYYTRSVWQVRDLEVR